MYWQITFVLIFIIFRIGYIWKSAEPVEKKKAVPVEVEVVGIGSIEQTVEPPWNWPRQPYS
jgi:hypothetical protein